MPVYSKINLKGIIKMKEEIENIIGYLKKMIDKNSSNYLIDNPFVVYTELIKHNNVDKK